MEAFVKKIIKNEELTEESKSIIQSRKLRSSGVDLTENEKMTEVNTLLGEISSDLKAMEEKFGYWNKTVSEHQKGKR